MSGVTIEDLLSYAFLGSVRFSPDGRHVALLVKRANARENRYDADLYLCDVEAGTTRRLTTSGKDGPFVWAADGESILFVSKRDEPDEGSRLYRISIHGGEAQPLVAVPQAIESLERLDADRLLFTARPSDEVDAADATERVRVLEEIPFWQNGKGFTSGRRLHLYALSLSSGESSLVLGGDLEVMAFAVAAGRCAVVARRFEGRAPVTSELWTVDASSGSASCVSRDELLIDAVAVRSDGALTVLATTGERYGIGESREVVLFDLDGSRRSLAPGWERMPGNRVVADCRGGAGASLRCADETVFVVVTEGGSSFLDRLGGDGTLDRPVGSAGSIDDFDVHGERVAFVGLREGRLQELYLVDARGERRLTSLNDAALSGRELALPEPFTATSPDGTRIDGWLMRPVGMAEGARCPAVLEIHGGPKAAYGTVFIHEMQLLAARGYAVIYCNPRGSAGRGDAFADLRGRYGTIDFDDVMAAVDEALLRLPAIDPERLGVTGGSYGGFMTNWIIGHTDRFKAAVSQRSIANWISKTCTTDIGYYFNADQMGTTPWAEGGTEKMWWHSPLRYADRVTTPTLFVHSEEDYRCWLDQGLQMFTALRYHGVEARLALFRGENHELSRSGKPLHRTRRLREMVDWFDRFLAAGPPQDRASGDGA